jgi:fumarate reductase flavoprotein subunit
LVNLIYISNYFAYIHKRYSYTLDENIKRQLRLERFTGLTWQIYKRISMEGLYSMTSKIDKTIVSDVVVVGSGISGLTAAVSAAEAGAKTILLEKGPTFNVRGLHNAAIGSRMQKAAGIEIDKDQVISTVMEAGAYHSDQKMVKLWADNSGQVMDWLLDLAAAEKVEVIIDTTTKDWFFPNYPLIHVFRPDRQNTLAKMLQDKAQKLGVEFHYETPAMQLIREGQGRVSGVIAQDLKSSETLCFKAQKGVVLCSGDYGGNREMVERYFSNEMVKSLKCAYEGGLNTGDGHQIAMQIGAAMDDTPHCAMLFDWAVWAERGLFNVARQPWLYVNLKGERFMNEDLPWGYECNQLLRQPEGKAWSIWDAKYNQEIPVMHSQCCKNMGPPTFMWDPRQLEEAIEKGNVITCSTLEGLAEKIKLPPGTFMATVERYNQMAREKRDLDYGKHPDRLTTLEKPLYYACQMEVRYMVILSGLKVNTRLQVLDTENRPIPGLYAAGNTSGSFFGGNVYPTTTPGLTHGRAWTFGRLAGLNAAAEKV